MCMLTAQPGIDQLSITHAVGATLEAEAREAEAWHGAGIPIHSGISLFPLPHAALVHLGASPHDPYAYLRLMRTK